MITVKAMRDIPTSRAILSFRSMPCLRCVNYAAADVGRAIAGQGQMQTHNSLRRWRHKMWHSQSNGVKSAY